MTSDKEVELMTRVPPRVVPCPGFLMNIKHLGLLNVSTFRLVGLKILAPEDVT